MAYLAGWIAHKMKSDKLGLKTSNEKYEGNGQFDSLAPWIFHVSRGGLKVPRDEFLLDVEKFEKEFIDFHGPKKLKKGENIINDFQEILILKYGPSTSYDYPKEMLCLFARARTFFRLRNNIQQYKDSKAEQNAKNALKRKEKTEKKFQIAFDKELKKREEAKKRSSSEEVSQAHSSSSAATTTAAQPKKQKLYKAVKDGRSFKQLGQHTT